MYTGILHLHITVVVLFLLLYAVKTFLLLTSSWYTLDKLTARTRIAEMIISSLFLLTGIYLWLKGGNHGTWLLVKVLMVFASIPLAVIGFKKRKKALALIAFLLLVFAYGIAEMKRLPWEKKQQPVEVAAGADLGKALYSQYCINCHGEDGNLGASDAKMLSESQLSDTEIATMINNGKGLMPSYKDKMTTDQIIAVTDYVKTLRKY